MLSRGNTLTIGNHSWHTTPGAFVFSNPHSSSLHSCVFCLTPFPEQFSWFATSVQRHPQVLTPPFDLRFVMQLFNRTPSHTICLSLCSYSAQSQCRLGFKKWAREIKEGKMTKYNSGEILCTNLAFLSGYTCDCLHDFPLISRSPQSPAGRGRRCCSQARARHVAPISQV
jgi:hypothetical protein